MHQVLLCHKVLGYIRLHSMLAGSTVSSYTTDTVMCVYVFYQKVLTKIQAKSVQAPGSGGVSYIEF